MKGNANTHYKKNRGVSQRKRRVQRNSSHYSQTNYRQCDCFFGLFLGIKDYILENKVTISVEHLP